MTRTGSREHVLVVCTANQCRSPLAAAILAAACAERGLDVVVDSAGVAAVSGIPATFETVDTAAGLGLDLSAHQSQPVSTALVERADLVLAMERRHLQEVVLTHPSAFPRTFTLKELVRRGTEVGPRGPDEPLRAWLARVHEGRRSADVVGISFVDDVLDPTGNPLASHRSTADELDALTASLLDLLFTS